MIQRLLLSSLIFFSFFNSSIAFTSINKLESTPWTVHLFAGQPLYNLKFEPIEKSSSNVEYKPNTGTTTGIGVSYGWLGISYVTKTDNSKVTDEKGKTTYDDYRLSFFFQNIYYSLRYLKYQGFYINNSSEIDPTLPASSPFITRQDISTIEYGINALWVLDQSSYSLPSLVDQTQRQESSGGSWIAGLASNQMSLSADSAIIPTQIQTDFGTDATLTSAEFTTLTLSFGYGHAYIFNKKFYINALLLVGGGLQIRSFTTSLNGNKSGDVGFSEKADLRLGFGYNGDTFFMGVSSSLDFTSVRTDTVKIQSTVPGGDFFIGAHF